MTFWIIAALLCLVALGFGIWPLYRESGRLTPLLAIIIVATVAVSVGLYSRIGSPDVASAGAQDDTLPDMESAIASLRQRLEDNPDDANGWNMLARSYMALQRFGDAVTAYERVMELEDSRNAQTLVDLALAISSRDGTAIEGRTSSLIESALALEPNNPAALFYSGIASANRGDTETAAARWEMLLGLNPPPEIRSILQQRVAEWRGVPIESIEVSPADAGTAPLSASTEAPAADPDAVVTARIALSDDALSALTADANVFVIARDPAQPSPPIAVSRVRLSDLPTVVSLGDAQSMVAGRALSGFEEFELLARVSLSGSPAAASGDWFGTLIVRPADTDSVFLAIDQQVP
ncbi:MAG: tetratricopeptide repeat protein [Woeseiaceae bacterium]